ncbi:MAG: 4-amino-4-deoxychorismate lyase [Caulobacter sp.]|nr:4-amino-4-deoxychorismate lyase [Caulobacter sp.]
MSLPLDDRGLLLGDGLFETLLAREGELILWSAHLDRLTRGCRVLGLPPPDPRAARRACEAAVRDAGLGSQRAAVRLTLTAGSGGRGLDRPAAPSPSMFATAAAMPAPSGALRLVTARVRRNEGSPASRLKSLSYLDNVLARREAAPAEALMLNTAGQIACAAVGNLFWMRRDRLITPALDCGVLDGVMRAQVLEAARVMGLICEEARLGRDALDSASGLFMTNSLVGVRTVSHLDGRAVQPHPVTARLAEAVAAVS